jgi:hypothetical protein
VARNAGTDHARVSVATECAVELCGRISWQPSGPSHGKPQSRRAARICSRRRSRAQGWEGVAGVPELLECDHGFLANSVYQLPSPRLCRSIPVRPASPAACMRSSKGIGHIGRA